MEEETPPTKESFVTRTFNRIASSLWSGAKRTTFGLLNQINPLPGGHAMSNIGQQTALLGAFSAAAFVLTGGTSALLDGTAALGASVSNIVSNGTSLVL